MPIHTKSERKKMKRNKVVPEKFTDMSFEKKKDKKEPKEMVRKLFGNQ